MKQLLVFALAAISVPALAEDTFRCTDAQGNVTYQQKSCPPGVQSKKVEIEDTRLTDSPEAEAAKNARRLEQLHQAFLEHLKAGDLDGARALATSPEEFKLVDQAAELKRKKEAAAQGAQAGQCQGKAAELARLQQQKVLHPEDNAARTRAFEAQSDYDATCR